MFVLVILEDNIKIVPEKFDQDNTDMILAEIDQKFINKVRYKFVFVF
jgi:DNA-directed RNA polymerase subunit E'/Rpb7